MGRIRLISLLAMAMLAAAAFWASAASAANLISGTVTDLETGKPIQGAEACVATKNDGTIHGCAITTANGTYEISLPPATNYIVRFTDEGNYLTQYFDDETSFGNADLIDTTGGDQTDIDAALEEAASISGRVTARKTGAPLGGIYVCTLYVYEYETDRCVFTKPDGTYLIDGLERETYKVSFNGTLSGQFFFSAYLPQFWNDQTSYESAVPISLTPPEARTGIDAQLLVPGESLEKAPETGSSPPPQSGGEHVAAVKCKRGFQKKKVKGKTRCVKKKKHRHRHRGHRGAGEGGN